MKKIVFALPAILAMFIVGGLNVEAKDKVPARYIPIEGVGPVVAGSTSATALPKKATKFIDNIGENVVSVEKEYASGKYEVKLSSGMEVEFDKHGKIVEIDAPENGVIGLGLVKEIVPHRMYKKIESMKDSRDFISSIERTDKGGYKVEYRQYIAPAYNPITETLFDGAGELIAQYY